MAGTCDRGTLVLDCRDFNNSGVEQCFAYGSTEPQPCKPPASDQAYPKLTQALASGQAIDGNEGSLCVLANTGSPLPPGAKSPFIPASAGGGACNLGLNCLNLGVSLQNPQNPSPLPGALQPPSALCWPTHLCATHSKHEGWAHEREATAVICLSGRTVFH